MHRRLKIENFDGMETMTTEDTDRRADAYGAERRRASAHKVVCPSDINELKEIEQNSLDELGLFMVRCIILLQRLISNHQDSVPFQTLSTIADNLEDRLQSLSDNMFKVYSDAPHPSYPKRCKPATLMGMLPLSDLSVSILDSGHVP